ncbi:MAG: exodeoxyribonuclease V subunit gamma, partial [Prochlorococcaceae cyanobacterium]
MLIVYRSNRAELLAQLLAQQLQLSAPPPFAQVEVVVNTWPTSRWLGEQLAIGIGGIAANLRFPFPGSQLRRLVDQVLDVPPSRDDPWRASQLVWPLLELLPPLVQQPEAQLLQRWLEERGHGSAAAGATVLDLPLWQLGRAIADAFDDYSLYRPEMVADWLAERRGPGRGQPLPPQQKWQPLLFRQLQQRLAVLPFGLRARNAIAQLQQAAAAGQTPAHLSALSAAGPLRLFGLSSLAPIQVELLQALSGVMTVELYLLTPCRDLWQRLEGSEAAASLTPLGEEWLLEAPRLEARFGRLGAEFQQLLEGSGASQLGSWQEQDLFLGAASAARHQGRQPSLLEQLQQQLVQPGSAEPLQMPPGPGVAGLEFHACPGRLRQV